MNSVKDTARLGGSDVTIPWLTAMFRSCLKFGYVPKSWRRAKIVFIPKIGKRGHEVAKDFRPISLTSFSLKTMERIVDLEVRENLPYAIFINQHAYCRGRSTDTALHAVVSTVENSTFLDIEGVFNNVSVESIEQSIVDSCRDRSITRWIMAV